MYKILRYAGITAAAFVSFSLTLLLIVFLSLAVFNLIDQNRFRSMIEEQLSEITGRQLSLAGNLHLELSLNPSLSIENITFANAEWSDRPEMLSAKKLYIKVNLLSLLNKQLVVEQLLLDDVELSVETSVDSQLNWQLEKHASNDTDDAGATIDGHDDETILLPFLPVLQQVMFNSVHIYYRDAIKAMQTTVDIESLLLTNPEIDQPINIIARGAVNQQPFDITGETRFLSSVTVDNIVEQGLAVKLDVDALGVKLAADGQIQNPATGEGIDITIALQTNDLHKSFTDATGRSIKQYLPSAGKPLPLMFSAMLKDIKNGYSISSIKIKLADSDLGGDLSYLDGKKNPEIIAKLYARKINLNPLLAAIPGQNNPKPLRPEKNKSSSKPAAKPVAGNSSNNDATGIQLPDTVLPFELLESIDTDIKLSVEQLIFDNIEPAAIKLIASTKDGLLSVKQLDLKLDDAPIRSSITVDTRGKNTRISTKLDIDRLQLKSVAEILHLEQIKSGTLISSLDLNTSGKSVRDLVLNLKGRADIQLNKTRISQQIKDQQHDAMINQLKLDYRGNNKKLSYALNGTIDDEPLSLSGELSTPASIINNQHLNFNADLDALMIKLDIQGDIEKPLSADQAKLTLALDIPDPRQSVRKLTRFLPETEQNKHLPGVPITVHTQLTASAKHYRLDDLRIEAGSSDLSGVIATDLSNDMPYIEANLQSQLINLNELLPQTILADEERSEKADTHTKTDTATPDITQQNISNRKLFSSEPLPVFDALEKLDMTIRYRLKKLTSNNKAINNISLDLKLKDSVLKLDPLSIEFASGTIKSQLTLSSIDTPYFQLDTKISKLSYDQLMTILGSKEYARGDMDAEIILESKGKSLSELMANLSGVVRATTVDGELDSESLKLLSKDIVSLIPFTDSSDRQKIECGVVQFDIKQGLASTHSMVINTGAISALGTGDINLANETLDMYVAPRSKRTSVIKIALVPVNITGSLASPSILPDLAGSTISTTKTATNIGLTIATSGIWLLAEGFTNDLWDKFVDDTDYCAKALAGEKIVPLRITLDSGADTAENNNTEQDLSDEDDW